MCLVLFLHLANCCLACLHVVLESLSVVEQANDDVLQRDVEVSGHHGLLELRIVYQDARTG